MKRMKGFFITLLDWTVWRKPCKCSKNILVLLYNLVDVIFLEKRVAGLGCSDFSVLLFLTDHQEHKLFCMRDYFVTLFCQDNSLNYHWYPIEVSPQSNNGAMRSRLINNITLPHICME